MGINTRHKRKSHLKSKSLGLLRPDGALSAIVGGEPLSKKSARRKVTKYVYTNCLLDAGTKNVTADEKLLVLFNGKEIVNLAQLATFVDEHFIRVSNQSPNVKKGSILGIKSPLKRKLDRERKTEYLFRKLKKIVQQYWLANNEKDEIKALQCYYKVKIKYSNHIERYSESENETVEKIHALNREIRQLHKGKVGGRKNKLKAKERYRNIKRHGVSVQTVSGGLPSLGRRN